MTTRQLPLRGADLVLMAMHSRGANAGLSNNTVLVVECDAPLDRERLGQAIDRLLQVCPWPAARLERPFPWGKLRWAAGPTRVPPPVRHRAIASFTALGAELEAEVNRAIDPKREPPVRFVVLDVEHRGSRRGVLAMTWFHPLMDPRGGQNLLAHLAEMARDDSGRPGNGTPPRFEPAPDTRPLRERGQIARRSLAYMRSLAPRELVSPGTGIAAHGSVRFRQQTFGDRRASVSAALSTREISWRLALVGKAMAELWQRRGLPNSPFLVPVSVDLRPKGESGATFGNCLAFHFARFKPSDTRDVAGLAAVLRRQMVEAIRDGQIEANAVAMEFLRYRPLGTMLRPLPWTAGGESFSFNCADIGEFPPALGTLFGSRVLNAYHAPAVLPRPGVGVFFNRCRDRHNLVASWVEGVVDEQEVARILDVVRDGMGWTPVDEV